MKRGLSVGLRRADRSATAYAPLLEAPLTLPKAVMLIVSLVSLCKAAGVMPR